MNASSLVEDGSPTPGTTTGNQSPPSQPMLASSSPAGQQAPTSAANHLSAHYSQFLASVRDFKPLVADLNTSIASIATSVTTMGADVRTHGVPEASQHYVGDVTLHSPISQPLQHEPDECRQHCQILHQDGVTHSQGSIKMCMLSVVWNMRWRATGQEVDQKGHGERLCKKIAKHAI